MQNPSRPAASLLLDSKFDVFDLRQQIDTMYPYLNNVLIYLGLLIELIEFANKKGEDE